MKQLSLAVMALITVDATKILRNPAPHTRSKKHSKWW